MASIKQPIRPTYVAESLHALRSMYRTEAEFIAYWELYSLRQRYTLSSMRYHNIWLMNPVLHTSTTPERCHRPDLTQVWWYYSAPTQEWTAVLAGFGAKVDEDQARGILWKTLYALRFNNHGVLKNDMLTDLEDVADRELMPTAENMLGKLTSPRDPDDDMQALVAWHINSKELFIRRESFERVKTS